MDTATGSLMNIQLSIEFGIVTEYPLLIEG